MSDETWKFLDPQNVAVFTTRHIFRDGLPILHVSHDLDDGSWQFHWGGDIDEQSAMIVGLREVVDHDPSIVELHDLPEGWIAWRKDSESEWIRVQKCMIND